MVARSEQGLPSQESIDEVITRITGEAVAELSGKEISPEAIAGLHQIVDKVNKAWKAGKRYHHLLNECSEAYAILKIIESNGDAPQNEPVTITSEQAQAIVQRMVEQRNDEDGEGWGLLHDQVASMQQEERGFLNDFVTTQIGLKPEVVEELDSVMWRRLSERQRDIDTLLYGSFLRRDRSNTKI